MRLTIHIGTTKTGSKTIQNFLVMNRQTLAAEKILVPRSLGEPINTRAVLASLPFGASTDLSRGTPIQSSSEHEHFRSRTVAQFKREVSTAENAEEVVITAELLHSRLTRQQHVQKFHDLFCDDFSEVRVIVYVRPQLDHIVSLYSTVLRNGYKVTVDEFIRSHMKGQLNPYFDLKDIITRWSKVFGEDKITVRPYMALRKGLGTLGDFCSFINIDASEDRWHIGESRNVSINEQGQKLLLILNQGLGLDDERRRSVIEWIERNHRGKGARPTTELAVEFANMFTQGNKWVVDKYFPGCPEYLESQYS